MKLLIALSLATTMLALSPALAHPGGLNAQGCHNNRKTADYHCHGGASTPAPSRPSKPAERPSFGAASTSGWSYPNCTAARAAGAAPIRRGEPGYGPHLDRDDDGVACEPYRGR